MGKEIIIKGYKALNKDMTSNYGDMAYELNKWYHEDEVNPCHSGFHYCKELINVLKYYYYYNNILFFEVEAKGIIKTDDDIEFVCSDIRLIRQISNKEFEKYISDNVDSLLKNNLNELIDYLQHTSDIDILIKLSKDENSGIRYVIAKNVNTPKKILAKLSEDDNWYVRKAVAGNKNTPKKILVKLSKDDDFDIKYAVAKNKNTPKKTLIKLSKNEDPDIRYAVAYNTNTPKKILVKLSKDDDFDIKYAVAKNKNTPKKTLIKLSEGDNWYIREIAKQNLESRNYRTNI